MSYGVPSKRAIIPLVSRERRAPKSRFRINRSRPNQVSLTPQNIKKKAPPMPNKKGKVMLRDLHYATPSDKLNSSILDSVPDFVGDAASSIPPFDSPSLTHELFPHKTQ